jgi:peptidoglycan hydrolase-like protein with peptidoglycan-binding domain
MHFKATREGHDVAHGKGGGAGLDRDGYFGDTTLLAVTRFQSDRNKLEQTGSLDEATFKAIFKGDPNVRVNL